MLPEDQKVTNGVLLRFLSVEFLIGFTGAIVAAIFSVGVLYNAFAEDVNLNSEGRVKNTKELEAVKLDLNSIRIDLGKISADAWGTRREQERIFKALERIDVKLDRIPRRGESDD